MSGTVKLSELLAAIDALKPGGFSSETAGDEPVIALLDAAPVLIEIAEAAIALGPELVYIRGPLSERLRDALSKVKP